MPAVPSDRTWNNAVSPPTRIASWVDQLASPWGIVVWVTPCTSTTTSASLVEYRR